MRWLEMNEELVGYVRAQINPGPDPVAERLAETTRERFGALAGMNIGEDQGRFLEMLVALMDARTVVEVGTFTGMSALWLARGLPDGGRLTCFDISDEFLPAANVAWEAAGVADRIDVRIGPAAETLAELPDEPHIDLAFIDADKTGYRTYLDLLLPRVNDRGVVLVDNVIWGGSVVRDDDQSDDTVAIRDFNRHVTERADCTSVMLAIGDGVTMIRPKRRPTT
jgi:caffeoyl-CoA O-methyltransferase